VRIVIVAGTVQACHDGSASQSFPDRIAVEDPRACFALSDADRRLVFAQRSAENRRI
jgi:hypothetical protein